MKSKITTSYTIEVDIHSERLKTIVNVYLGFGKDEAIAELRALFEETVELWLDTFDQTVLFEILDSRGIQHHVC